MIHHTEIQITFIISFMLIGLKCEGDTFVHHECKLPMHQRVDKPDRPECQRIIPMYYFNTETNTCETTTEKGCPANLNSFNSYYSCMTYCLRPIVQKENCNKRNLIRNCSNFEHKYFKYFFDGKSCLEFAGDCQFNGNHFHNRQHCETTCGEFMDPTKKGHFVNIVPERKSWCFERFSFNVDDSCMLRQMDPNQQKVKYRFDYSQNNCKMLDSDQCTFNGNVFNTIEECLLDCRPAKFDCQNCDKDVLTNKYKAHKCRPIIVEGRIQCQIISKKFNWSALQKDVEKIRSNSNRNHSTIPFTIFIILIAFLKLFASFSQI